MNKCAEGKGLQVSPLDEDVRTLLQGEHDFFRLLIATLPSMIWLKDLKGRYLACNPAFEQFFGAREADIIGKTNYDFLDEEEANFYLERDLLAIRNDGPASNEEWLTLADGRHILLAVTKVPMRNAKGEVIGVLGIGHDITERNQYVEQLRASEEKLRGLYELAPLGIALTDMDGRYVQFNAAFAAICGYSADELATLDYWTLTPEKYRDSESRLLRQLDETGSYGPYEKEYQRKDGSLVPVNLNGRLITGADGKPYIWSIVENITERKRVERELRQAANVFHFANEGIMITADDGTILDTNAMFTAITGYTLDEVQGRTPRILSSGRHSPEFFTQMWQSLEATGHWKGEIWNRRKNGDIYPELLTISAIRNEAGAIQRYVSLFSDISAQKEYQHRLEHLAHYDALTQLPNRVLLADRLRLAMTQATRRTNTVVVAYLDLDGFKDVNDTHGHDMGDLLLVVLASRMRDVLREGDTLARIGGDEFVAILPDLGSVKDCEVVVKRLLKAASDAVLINGENLRVSASIGIAAFPQPHDIDADQLMRQADQAMYQAKQTGKNRFHIFDAHHDEQVRHHHETIERISEALEHNELRLVFQPKVNLRSGKVVGAEALIRWQHPQRGMVSPGEFLPIVENDDLIIDIGEWTITAALKQMEHWQTEGIKLPISVNIAGRHLQWPDFPAELEKKLAQHPSVGPLLELEVLESSAIDDIAHASRQMQLCSAHGVEFAIDDFGTGYSSLTYLKRLPAGTIKIDQSFVRDMLVDADDLAILEGVLGLATAFGRSAIAEGVETVAHCEMLLRLGCELAQGYGIARPMSPELFVSWVGEWDSSTHWRSPPRLDNTLRPVLLVLIEHRTWMHHMELYLSNHQQTPPLLNPCDTRLGHWLEGGGLAAFSGIPIALQLADQHNCLHAQGLALVEMKQANQIDAAKSGYDMLLSISAEIITTLETLLDSRN